MSGTHELTVHTVRCERFWLTCSCGWRADVLSNNWDVWGRIHGQHLQEAAQQSTGHKAPLNTIERNGND